MRSSRRNTQFIAILLIISIIFCSPLFPLKIIEKGDENYIPISEPDKNIPIESRTINDIFIITPEDINYTEPMYGYYPASHGFEDNQTGWFDKVVSLGGPVRVIPQFEDHMKVLEMRDNLPYFNTYVSKTITPGVRKGTLEYWMSTDDSSKMCGFTLDNNAEGDPLSPLIILRTWEGYLQRFNGTQWISEVKIENSKWHHIRIDFDCEQRRWFLFVDLLLEGGNEGFDFLPGEDQVSRAIWFTDYSPNMSGYSYYLDAIGLSWDPYYAVSENCFEGLLLYFKTVFELTEITYSLDGMAAIPISGPTVFPMPDGSAKHTIQVFGEDSMGFYHHSALRRFEIDKPDLICIHGLQGLNNTFWEYWIDNPLTFPDLDGNSVSDFVDYYGMGHIFCPKIFQDHQHGSAPEFEGITALSQFYAMATAFKNYIIRLRQADLIKPNLDLVGHSGGGMVIRYLIEDHYQELLDAGIVIRHAGIIASPCHGIWEGGNNWWLVDPNGNQTNRFATFGIPLTRLNSLDETPKDIIYNTYAGQLIFDFYYGIANNILRNCLEGKACSYQSDYALWIPEYFPAINGYSRWNKTSLEDVFNHMVEVVGKVTDGLVDGHTVALEGARNNRYYSPSEFGYLCALADFSHGGIQKNPSVIRQILWDLRRGNCRAPEEILILSPENIIYDKVMSGYYPSTYGFEEDSPGSKPSCFETINSFRGTVKVISELDGHRNVVDLNHKFLWLAGNSVIKEIPERPSFGTIEYWMRTDDAARFCGFQVDNGASNPIIQLRSFLFSLQYWDTNSGNWQHIMWIAADEWYHFRIDFECSMGKYEGLRQYHWQLYINGINRGNFSMNLGEPQACRMIWSTDFLQEQYHYYIDAIGVSWDPAYEIGDNLKEGLVLTFQKNFPATWIGYSLDGRPITLIKGNRTIPMPEEGSHTIQVVGQTLYGKMCQSPTITFFAHHELHLDILQHLENNFETPPGVTLYYEDDLNITITYQTRWGPILTTWTNISLYYKINEESWNDPYGLGFGEGIQTASFVIKESNYSKYDDLYYYFHFHQIDNSSTLLKEYYLTQDGIKDQENEARAAAFHKQIYPFLFNLTLNYSLWYKAQDPTNMTTDQGNNVTIYPTRSIRYENIGLNFHNTTLDEMNYSVSCITQPNLAHSINSNTTTISKNDGPVFTLSQDIKSPFTLARNLQYIAQVSTILIPEILFDSLASSSSLVFTDTLLNLTYQGTEKWPSSYRTVYKFASNTTLVRFDCYTGIMVYLEHNINEENASQQLIWGLVENNRNFPNTLDVSPRYETVDHGTILIPEYLLTIVHDPPGDHSYGKVEMGTSTYLGLCLNVSEEMALYLDKKFLGAQLGEEVYLNVISVESESYDGEITLTYAKDLSSSQETEDAAFIGPGRGDLYYGVSLVVQYYIKMMNYYIIVGSPDKPNSPQNDIKVWENGSKLEYNLNYSSEFNLLGKDLAASNKTHLMEHNVFADNIISAMEASLVEECSNSPLFWSPDMPVNLYYPTIAQPNTIIDLTFKFTQEKFFTWCQEEECEIFNAVINTTTGEIEMSLELFYNTTGSSATKENRQITCHLEDNDGMPIGEHDQFYMQIYRDLRYNTYGYIVYEDFTYTSRPYEIGTRDRRSPAGFMFLNLGEYIHGTTILTCSAIDEETGVKCIEFYYDDDQNFGSDSIFIGYQENCTITNPNLYEITWNTTNLGGTYYLFAIIYDSASISNSLVSEVYSIQIDNDNPTLCQLRVYPPYKGGVTLFCNAFDADSGIELVEYWDGDPEDNESVLLGVSNAIGNSFRFIWATDPEGIDDGIYNIYARAYDKAGNYLDSNSVEIKIDQSSGGINLSLIWISIIIGSIAIISAIVINEILRRQSSRLPPSQPPKQPASPLKQNVSKTKFNTILRSDKIK